MKSQTSLPGSLPSTSKPRHRPEPARRWPALLPLVGALSAALPALAQQIETVVVSGSGVARRAFNTPYSVSVVDAGELRAAGPMVNLSEAMARVPGLTVNQRNNYAQDLQISSRGFGARSSFGVRGMRLYTDGIPASGPDGQGQVSHFDLAGAQRIEVLRGPFSALYGNSSGGVISLISAAPTERAFEAGVDVGSDGLRQVRVMVETPLGDGWDIRAQGSHFETDGPREHSAARRTLGNLRLGWQGENDSVVLLFNAIDQPAQDPLGLTRAQFNADPTQTTPEASTFDTRKTIAQTQLGGQWHHRFGGAFQLAESVVTAYSGQRAVTQWQAIPVATQTPTRHPGGVIDFGRDYQGLDGRLVWRWDNAQLITGLSVDTQDEARRGYENFIGPPTARTLGVTGKLRRDESNNVRSNDAYAQGEFDLTPTLTASAGVRGGAVRFSSSDHYLSNGDDSGSLRYSYTNPVAALRWAASEAVNLYVSGGRGFESPTLTELAYRPDGAPGFNTDLKAQTSQQLEVGAKWRDSRLGLGLDAAVFRADTDDEIGVRTNSGGRSTYQNVGRTRREGAELGLRWQATRTLRTQVALTWLDATYRDGFLTCTSAPCTTPAVVVAAGNRIAGTMKKSGYAEFAWQALADTELALELRAQGSMAVNDTNSDFAASNIASALRASYKLPLPVGKLELRARVDNLEGRHYAGSVIVNESNGRYFEPAAGRTLLLGANWRVAF